MEPAVPPAFRRARGDAGFTLIETLVSAVVLIVGLLGTFALVDAANGRDSGIRAREGALNLSREALEDARTVRYAELTPSTLPATLQSLISGSTASGSSVTVSRRGVAYTMSVGTCSIDDAKDGLGDHGAMPFCADSPQPSAPYTDAQPEDLKRVTATVSWNGGANVMTQAMMLSASGQAVGLPVRSLAMDSPGNVGSDPTAPVITTASTPAGSCAAANACFTATAPGAQRIAFYVDGVQHAAGVTSDASGWHFPWTLTGLSDGDYKIEARAVDAFGVQGAAQTLIVKLYRQTMSAPQQLAAGYNNVNDAGSPYNVVELQWRPNPERNVVGYDVLDSTGALVCPTTAGVLDPTPSCIDFSPPPASTTTYPYTVQALYQDPSGNAVAGPASTVSVKGQALSTSAVTTRYGFANTTANVGAASTCYQGATTARDATRGFTGTSTQSTYGFSNSRSITFCSTPNAAVTTVPTGPLPFSAYFRNTFSKSCTVSWRLLHNATYASPLASGSVAIPGRGTKIVALQPSITGFSFATGDQIGLVFTFGASNCGSTSVGYGGTAAAYPNQSQPGWIDLTTGVTTLSNWPRPNAPTALAATPVAGGTQLSWSAPTGTTPVAFYRIYRGGTDYTDRYDTCDTTCVQANGTLRYVDSRNTGGPYPYYVTAVGADAAGKPTMAESAFSAGATG